MLSCLLTIWVFATIWHLSHASRTGTSTSSPIAPIIDVGYAKYQGYYNASNGITEFIGIRYAAPPTGDLRFAAPQVPSNISGIQQANTNPNMCYQSDVSASDLNDAPESEDCLFLNVLVPGYVPTKTTTVSGIPVLVWVHGGAYTEGDISRAEYNATDLVINSHHSLIIVAIQYRLGLFGFLAGQEIKDGGVLNAGLLDQQFAFRWIHENISKFGGDPSHVTIWGQSAGAGSMLQHIVANNGNTQPPLFHAVISSSTFLPSQYWYNDTIPQYYYNETVSLANCTSADNTLACLRALNASQLGIVNNNITTLSPVDGFAFVPVVDGTFIADRPTVLMQEGRVNGELYLAFGNSHEGTDFVNAEVVANMSVAEYVSALFPKMDLERVQEAAYVYRDMGTPLEQMQWIQGDSILLCPTYYMLAAFPGRSWRGFWAVPPGLHADDLKYYFNNTAPPYDNPVFDASYVESYMSFARFFDVNQKFDSIDITPYWEAYAMGNREMLFNHTESGEPVIQPFSTDQGLVDRCAFWHSISEMIGQ